MREDCKSDATKLMQGVGMVTVFLLIVFAIVGLGVLFKAGLDSVFIASCGI